jgi:hypothetical protein
MKFFLPSFRGRGSFCTNSRIAKSIPINMITTIEGVLGYMMGQVLRWCVCALAIFMGVSASSAQTGEISQMLYDSTAPNAANDGRDLASGVPIRALIQAGYLRKKPEARLDYSDFRLMRKPFDFLGASLVVIEEQYMTNYIGCCVDPGIGMVFENSSGSNAMARLATANSCEYSADPTTLQSIMEAVGLAGQKGEFVYLFCGSRQLQDGQ